MLILSPYCCAVSMISWLLPDSALIPGSSPHFLLLLSQAPWLFCFSNLPSLLSSYSCCQHCSSLQRVTWSLALCPSQRSLQRRPSSHPCIPILATSAWFLCHTHCHLTHRLAYGLSPPTGVWALGGERLQFTFRFILFEAVSQCPLPWLSKHMFGGRIYRV